MEFGIFELGRMGAALALQALEKGHEVVGFDPGRSEEVQEAGAAVVDSIGALAGSLDRPRVALVYVPQGDPTEQVLTELGERFDDADVIVDGGNSHWDETVRRHETLAKRGIRFQSVALLRHEYGEHPLTGQASGRS